MFSHYKSPGGKVATGQKCIVKINKKNINIIFKSEFWEKFIYFESQIIIIEIKIVN